MFLLQGQCSDEGHVKFSDSNDNAFFPKGSILVAPTVISVQIDTAAVARSLFVPSYFMSKKLSIALSIP